MANIRYKDNVDESIFDKAGEEFKRSMTVYNKELNEAIKKNFGTLFSPMIDFFKDYRESTKESLVIRES